jgi:hypothetical protein
LRKVLLLASLCMVLALVLSAPAMAQSASASPPAGEGNPCFGLEGAEAEECYAEFGIGPPASAPPVALCTDPDFPRETPDGCQASDLPDVEFGPDASPTASATASASASASVEALPETGGPVSVLALGSLALLVGSGIMAFGIMRRN